MNTVVERPKTSVINESAGVLQELFKADSAGKQLQSPPPGYEATLWAHLYRERSLPVPTMESIQQAINKDAVARRVLAKAMHPCVGDVVGVRLNLNIERSSGALVHTIHKGTTTGGHTRGKGLYRGEVVAYLPVVVLKNVYLNVHQVSRDRIASGMISKCPMASIDGTYIEQPEIPSFAGVEVNFNPVRTHLFLDEEGFAIAFAEEATVCGHRAYLRGRLEYFRKEDAPNKVGDSPSCAKFRQ